MWGRGLKFKNMSSFVDRISLNLAFRMVISVDLISANPSVYGVSDVHFQCFIRGVFLTRLMQAKSKLNAFRCAKVSTSTTSRITFTAACIARGGSQLFANRS